MDSAHASMLRRAYVPLSVRSFEDDFPGAVRCALTETHRLPVHLLRSSTGLMRAGGLVPLLNNRMKTRQNTGELMGRSFQQP